MEIKLVHVRKTISAMLLMKSAVGFAFATLTLCGVSAPFFGIDLTPAREAGVASIGGLFGAALVALRV